MDHHEFRTRLAQFVEKWGPPNPDRKHEFKMALSFLVQTYATDKEIAAAFEADRLAEASRLAKGYRSHCEAIIRNNQLRDEMLADRRRILG